MSSFSAVSKRIFASKYSLESSRRDLHNALLCTVLESTIGNWDRSLISKCSLKIAEMFTDFLQSFRKVCQNFADFLLNCDQIFSGFFQNAALQVRGLPEVFPEVIQSFSRPVPSTVRPLS